MRYPALLALAALALTPSPLIAAEPDKPLTPDGIVAAAPASDWTAIAASDLMVMELAPDAKQRPRRVVIQMIPAPFSQGWVENVRKLVAARWFDGTAVIRSQDNYVVQWGDPDGDDPKTAKALPGGLRVMAEVEYVSLTENLLQSIADIDPPFLARDPYAAHVALLDGWPIAHDKGQWPIHCYGMVGVGRGLSPNTGDGSSLYVVNGTPPRQLDRNIALVGRVIEGMQHLSTLPRGTGPLGFYETPEEYTPIVSVRMGGDVAGLPAYEYLSTESASFAAYASKRANRKDDFYITPAGGVDVCNVPVPVRRAGGAVTAVGK